jgi:predicted ATPase
MITRLEIDGFKSLRDFAVDLEPLTVFIGPNSAGKSNVLDALALLSRLASQPVEEAFKQGRGRAIDQFTRRGGEAGTTIRFAVEVLVPGVLRGSTAGAESDPIRYELVIARHKMASGAERFAIKDESMVLLDRAATRWLALHPGLPGTSHDAPAAVELLRSSTQLASETALRGVAKMPREAARKLDVTAESEMTALADELSAYRLLHLDASHMRAPSERLGSEVLAPDASNLPTVLANLPVPTLGEIRADLVSLVPGISSFDVVPDDDEFRLDFELSGGERLPARLISDGTLRILALLTALRLEPRPSVIGIEEPENGVYPGRLRKLIDYLQEIAAQGGEGGTPPTQLILTTHSPVVLAALRSRPEHVRFVDLVRRDGQLVTRARTVGTTSAPDRGRLSISLREIDELLQAADSEIGR